MNESQSVKMAKRFIERGHRRDRAIDGIESSID